ncbi:ATPase, YjeE family [Desulfosporosinus orientis DSM 765]|uniref:tRNA threonylcarbamoyladenosine biosynthesis protein TsaE n=1 Tax=Desulfosporosinus orientis (strain ATCC 19365 / DSM 765 / NCIMB 8382 / VKM B-1628 / Singapore I) TaxID=768706 RepID=G7W5B9_DESOD|nr:tRNA (adenosine(37)-N6)-threonylcarbamoyltransferase complex ATPase subunit type 1 TsaE [Desulfosporosinus orientis]AET66347.1 ATPase, YjeE family [Desulfosporosinus orientis DSM 765]
MDYKVTSNSVEYTHEIGKQLGRCLQGGDVIALIGDLGAGKTAFAQGVGEGLGVASPMASPTFTLIHEYKGQRDGTEIRLIHMDLYRLRHPEEAEVIGIADTFTEDAVCIIEWPEIAEDYLPDDRLTVGILGSGEMTREIVFQSKDSGWEKRLDFLSGEAE